MAIESKDIKLTALKKFVRSGEGSHIEFKLKTTHPEKIMREAVAFANTDGGRIILGVSDSGELSGLKFPDEDIYVMERAFEKYVSPEIVFELDEIKLENGRKVLIYEILPNTNSMVLLKYENEEKVYVRNQDRSIQASREVRAILKQRFKKKSYRFQYGEKETLLMKFLDQNENITLRQFSEIAQISTKQASQTLVLLVLAGVLKVIPKENEDNYMLAHDKNE